MRQQSNKLGCTCFGSGYQYLWYSMPLLLNILDGISVYTSLITRHINSSVIKQYLGHLTNHTTSTPRRRQYHRYLRKILRRMHRPLSDIDCKNDFGFGTAVGNIMSGYHAINNLPENGTEILYNKEGALASPTQAAIVWTSKSGFSPVFASSIGLREVLRQSHRRVCSTDTALIP